MSEEPKPNIMDESQEDSVRSHEYSAYSPVQQKELKTNRSLEITPLDPANPPQHRGFTFSEINPKALPEPDNPTVAPTDNPAQQGSTERPQETQPSSNIQTDHSEGQPSTNQPLEMSFCPYPSFGLVEGVSRPHSATNEVNPARRLSNMDFNIIQDSTPLPRFITADDINHNGSNRSVGGGGDQGQNGGGNMDGSQISIKEQSVSGGQVGGEVEIEDEKKAILKENEEPYPIETTNHHKEVIQSQKEPEKVTTFSDLPAIVTSTPQSATKPSSPDHIPLHSLRNKRGSFESSLSQNTPSRQVTTPNSRRDPTPVQFPDSPLYANPLLESVLDSMSKDTLKGLFIETLRLLTQTPYGELKTNNSTLADILKQTHTEIFMNHGQYIGTAVSGLPSGKGRWVYADGSTYTGTFINGEAEGFGTLTLPQGIKYSGEFSRGYKHGIGSMHYDDSYTNKQSCKPAMFYGLFSNDRKMGPGFTTYRNGDMQFALYDNDLEDGISVYINAQRDEVKIRTSNQGQPYGDRRVLRLVTCVKR